ncbi:hypothetical protein ACH5RR_004054 [Cinchona calisaya]|uniref:C3H1-type domain-containing protein n=1 Tax=Cinchona calisaya TaxID=153742 RepID=A0ABD3AX33_9GENT
MEISELGSGLKPPQNPPFTFPPRRLQRRRPLQSQTYRTLVTILSHCNTLQASPHSQIPDYNDAVKLGAGAAHEALVNHNGLESGISLVQQKLTGDETKEVHGFQDGGNDTPNEVDRLDPINITEQGKEVVMQENNVNLLDSSIVKNQTCDIPDEKDICSVVDLLQELSPRRELKVLNEPSVNEVPETVSSSINMVVTTDMSIPVESSNKTSPAIEGHLSGGLEHELQLKQKELEKLICTSGNLEPFLCETEDGEIEEGEIPGQIDEAMDLLFEDAVSLEEKNLDKVQISEHVDVEVFTCDDGEDARFGKCDTRSSMFLDAVDHCKDIMELETKCTRKEQHKSAEVFAHREDTTTKTVNDYDTIMETGWTTDQVSGVNKKDHPAISLETLARHGLMHEDTTENKSSANAEMEASDGKKKKKKGPLTKERKAKKKQKERIKRAEKNRKLGVKRLKLQPVLKPKTVTYCRHYLKGRCQEGEKCKFSHDTTPLTKSTPCSYFARHSCMKGDNCPFDHQLSKYPCNNIVTKGFCSRGAGCLFSHEISSKDDSLPTLNVSKPEFKSPSLISESNSKKQVNSQGIPYQRVDAKFSTIENFSGKDTENKVLEHLDRPSAQIPKGICLISHVRSTPGNTSKDEQAAPHLKGDNSEKLNSSLTSNLLDSIQKSNDVIKEVPLKMPRGINFLSFGKRPLDDSLIRDYGVSKSLLGQLNKSKLVDSPSKNEGGVVIDNQAGQSSSQLEPKVNKVANILSPPSTPQALKFLSFGKAPVDNPSAFNLANMLPDNVNTDLPCVQEKKNALDGLKFSDAMPQRLASSSQLLSLDQSGTGNCGGMSSSSKTSLVLNTPSLVQKALHTTLAFAAKLDSEIKLDQSLGTPSGMNKHES